MNLLMRPRPTELRFSGIVQTIWPQSAGAGSSKGPYWRAGVSVMRRGALLLALVLLALIVLAAGSSPIGTR